MPILPHWRLILTGSLIAALLLLYALWRHEQARAEKAETRVEAAEALLKLAKREATADRITSTVKAEVVKAQAEVRYRTVTLIKEVPVYVTPEADSRCTVPVGFVRLHDAAASGEASVPEPAGGSVEAPSGVPLSEALGTVVGNYGVAYEWRAEALGWRSWYVEQKAAWDKR